MDRAPPELFVQRLDLGPEVAATARPIPASSVTLTGPSFEALVNSRPAQTSAKPNRTKYKTERSIC
ncbi:hypothetical protein [Amycolatopsis sp. lyj-112]|uniref:hypothetical protein n=1 Tax=Amycolatopsis sp. lyj-112 TaxID=2789288 RepID=UPI00397C8F36